MTTAHKPTWRPAIGGEEQGGNRMLVPTRQYSAKDLPGMLHMKKRAQGQGSLKEQDKIDFK
jgi:protein CWC15